MTCRDSTKTSRNLLGLAAVFVVLSAPLVKSSELPPGVRVDARAEPGVIGPGQVVELELTITIPEGWVVYDLEQTANSVQPTRITLDRSEDFSPLGGYQAPGVLATRDPAFQNRIVRYFAQSPTFCRPLVFSARLGPGSKPIAGHIDFQLHDPATGKYLLVRKASFATSVELRTAVAKMEPDPEPGPLSPTEAAAIPAALASEADDERGATPLATPPMPTPSPVPTPEEEREERVANAVAVVEVRPGELDLPLGDSFAGTRRPAADRDRTFPTTPMLVLCVVVGIALGMAAVRVRSVERAASQAAARWVTMLWRRAR